MNNLSSYCGLVDVKIRASDKDLSTRLNWVNSVIFVFVNFSGQNFVQGADSSGVLEEFLKIAERIPKVSAFSDRK